MADRWYTAIERLYQSNGDPVKRGQIDSLIGTSGANTFVLGAWDTPYYDDQSANTSGLTDYALIKNFEVGVDRVQLVGSAQDYLLGTSPISNIQGTGIFLDQDRNGILNDADELIGIIEGRPGLSLAELNASLPPT